MFCKPVELAGPIRVPVEVVHVLLDDLPAGPVLPQRGVDPLYQLRDADDSLKSGFRVPEFRPARLPVAHLDVELDLVADLQFGQAAGLEGGEGDGALSVRGGHSAVTNPMCSPSTGTNPLSLNPSSTACRARSRDSACSL